MFSGPFSTAALVIAFSAGALLRWPIGVPLPALPAPSPLGERGVRPEGSDLKAAPSTLDSAGPECPPCLCQCSCSSPPDETGGPTRFLLRLGADLQWAGLSLLSCLVAFLVGCCCNAARGHPAEAARSRVPAALARLEGYRF